MFKYLMTVVLVFGVNHATHAGPNETLVLVVGDSLSASFGISTEYGWVALLDEQLRQERIPARVVNASISGETSLGGLMRLPKLLEQYPADIVIIELGGNDGLRGLPLNTMQDNLRKMIQLSQAKGARPLLIGNHIPPNYGTKYTRQFYQSFLDLAQQENTALVPFLLEGVAAHDGMMQDDGIHPTALAQAVMLQNVLPHLLPLIQADHGPTSEADP